MNEPYCRCPGCGECSAHRNEKKLREAIAKKDAALAAVRTWANGWSSIPYEDPWKHAAKELLQSLDKADLTHADQVLEGGEK